MADKAEEKSSADKGDTKSVASKVKGYVARSEVKELYSALKVSAQVIDGTSKTIEILSKPWVTRRLPSIAAKLGKVTKLSAVLGPAGVAVGVAVDILSAIGLVQDAVMAKLDQISRQIDDLRDDVNKGFADIKVILDRNLALMPFLTIYNKLQAQVEVYEQNVVGVKIDAAIFSKRLAAMIHENTINEIIYDLKQIHNMISGNAFEKPLFEELARGARGKEGTEFDQFMANLFCQFQAVLALEIRAVRMLRSFLAFSDKDITYGHDIKRILSDLGTQRHNEYDPVPLFQWYLDFMSKGGKFNVRVLKPDNRYLYVEYGNHRVSGWKSYPGPKGEFTIEPCYDRAHVSSGGNSFHVWCKYYPNEFMDLRGNNDNADVKTRKKKSDLEAHWYFTIVDMETKVFKLSTVKWPDRYVYMQDDSFTEVRGCDDRHKNSEQAKFQLHPI